MGGYFGGRLAKGEAEVTFIARVTHFASLKKDGLRITSKLGDLHIGWKCPG
jgi:2-dehydropantoate 2-reductase